MPARHKIFSGYNIVKLPCIAILIVVIIGFTSCEKDVDIKLDSGAPVLVVEGGIETGLPPYVVLTNTIGFFGQVNAAALQSSFVHGAKVSVSNSTETVVLKEFSIDTGGISIFHYYTVDTSQGNPSFVGVEEKTYTLSIEYNGQLYEAYTKIPTPTPLDSVLSVYPAGAFNLDKYPNARQIRISFHDPDTIGNYIQYYTKRNDEFYYPGLNSVYSDELINGSKFAVTLSLGESRSTEYNDTIGTARVNDMVTLRWCAITKATFDFWSTYEYSLGTIGNPFATPINLKGNISNNAIGIWAGYGSKYYTIVIE